MNLRTFMDGDETKLFDLFAKQYQKFCGFQQSDPSQWYLRYVKNESVGKNRILIIEDDQILGYCVYATKSFFITLPKQTGILYDLCISKKCNWKSAGKQLLQFFGKKLHDENISDFYSAFPANIKYVKKILESCGCTTESHHLTLGIAPTDYENFLKHRISKCEWFSKKYFVNILLYQNFSNNLVTFGVNGKISVQAGSESSKDVVEIESGLTDFMDIISGDSSILKKILSQKITIRPQHRIPEVTKLLNQISFKGTWFIPTIDWR